MSKITDTILIFGRSPFMNSVDINFLKNLGLTTIAINKHEFDTDYVSFIDIPMAEVHEQFNGIIITQSRYDVREPFIHYDEFSYDFTHDYVLRWLHGKCKEVILIGCADFCNTKHYNSEEDFLPDEGAIKRSIKFIEGITDFKVYKMNPNSVLNIPVKNLKNI